MGFKRARTEEQRNQRRRQVLATAAAMLAEMPVAKVSLNELSRRTCNAVTVSPTCSPPRWYDGPRCAT